MKLTDDEFVTAFENLSLGAESFGHRDHVRLAWIYLNRYPAHEALPLFANGLRQFRYPPWRRGQVSRDNYLGLSRPDQRTDGAR